MIRNYNKRDLDDVMTIWYQSQSIAHPFLSEDFVNQVKIMMLEKFIPNSKTWVYELEGCLVGFIAMMGNEIGGLFVSPNSQSNGIGTLLVNHVSQFYENLEVEVFHENKIGRPFYVKQGFTALSEYIDKSTNQKVIKMQRQK